MQEVFKKIKQKLYLKADVCNDSITVSDKPLYFDGKEDGLREAIEIVDQVAEEYNNGWIPCSERLPEIYGEYLVTLELNWFDEILYATDEAKFVEGDGYVDDHWGTRNGWNKCKKCSVIAWQPLPKPYKKEV